jgi:arabinose-5-phosphate isomerase
VVVSGMGKSGHVARKIAATLASTGTPAQFVHPAEASHGDMGAITAKDAVLMLSNSGETRELGDLIAHTRRYRIPLVGIAGQATCTLIQTADVGLVLPPVAEACPMGLAPTTSTTMMLALGDALAVALMERRGFTAEQYRVLHPGGALGRALIRVEDIMHTGDELPLVARATPMREVLIEMTGKRFGCAGVTDRAGRLIGIITDGDLRRHMADGMLSLAAEAVMTKKPLTIRKSALAAEALGIMNARESPVTCLFVVGDETRDKTEAPRPIGIVHLHDCLRAGVG